MSTPPVPKRRKVNATATATSSAVATDDGGAPVAASAAAALCKALQEENAALKGKLADAERRLKEQNPPAQAGTSKATTSKKAQQSAEQQGAVDELVYVPDEHAAFLRKFRKAKAVRRLDLSRLQRTTSSFAGGRGGLSLFALLVNQQPKWRPDKKVDAVVAALLSGTEDVQELVLGDARWATDWKYAAEMLKVLRRFKKSVTTLSVTMRALVQTSSSGNPKVNNIDIVGAMPSLATLSIDVTPVDNHYNAYGGEFDPSRGSWGRSDRKTAPFARLRSVSVCLTRDWCDSQFGSVDDICGDGEDYDSYFESVGGGNRESEHDDQTPDLLQHRADVITSLDMSAFFETCVKLPIVDLFAGLTKLRFIALRGCFLHITRDMTLLEEVRLELPADTDFQAVAKELAESEALKGLHRLTLRAPQGAAGGNFAPSAVLAAAARRLTKLRSLTLDGVSCWRPEDLSAALKPEEGGALRPLESLQLGRCGPASLLPSHLPLLAALPHLRTLTLPQRMQAEAAAKALAAQPGLAVVWQ